MSVYRVIDKLENVVKEGVWLPFGGRVVNSDRVLDLIEKLRSTLPEELNHPKAATGDVARIAGQGKGAIPGGAQRAGEESNAFAAAEALQSAQAKSDAIITDAQAQAKDIRRGADEYADQVLSSLDTSLGKALAAVQKGRQTLAASTSAPHNGKTQREMSTL